MPIVEPEILIDGDYDIQRSSSVSQEVYQVGQTARLQVSVPPLSAQSVRALDDVSTLVHLRRAGMRAPLERNRYLIAILRIRFAGVQACIAQLWRHNVDLEATLLKPMMVMPGADAGSKASPEDVAQATLNALRR